MTASHARARAPRTATETLSCAEARRIALGAQGFSRPRPARPGMRHLHTAMARMGVLQIDSVNVFARSHYLPLFARLGAYDPALVERAFLSAPRTPRPPRYTEYPAHEATFLPVQDWPLWGFRRDSFRARYAAAWEQPSSVRILDWVRAELGERGPSRAAELRRDPPPARRGWGDGDVVKEALEHLWRIGEVAIAGRAGFERRYARAEHVIPDTLLGRDLDRSTAIGELVGRAARAHGVATAADIADYYRIRDRARVQSSIDALVESGELQPVRVQGWERGGRPIPAWRHTDATLPRQIDTVALLTPFDPVVWFRDRAMRAFELDYRIEIYTPAARRRFGYYSLPVLVDDRICARVDLKSDRGANTLRVQSAWWEPQAMPAEDASRIAEELRIAARWQGLEHLSVSGWGNATEDLARALHAHPERVRRHESARTDQERPLAS